MKLNHLVFPIATILAIGLMTTVCHAGWSDTLKDAGSQYANDTAKDAGLPYTPSEAIEGVREILSLSTDSAVSTLGRDNGFSNNPAVSIPLPDFLKGLDITSALTSSMNKAAEAAVPSTGPVFLNTIRDLPISNPASLLGGADNAITSFFEQSSRATLKELVKPIISETMDKAGAGTYLNAIFATQQATTVTESSFDINDYVTDRTLDGMFQVMSIQEKNIRSGSGTQTSALLKKLF
ncbi:MAG: DUF4197 domain-containing protein [Pseudodesulfovibrio sp.]|nr:DUF4197 domain-containing protein [Pseudodesulfovibrio sp.]